MNVRSEPNGESEILGKLYDNSAGTIEEETDGWYKITSGSVTGYVKADYVVTGDEAEALAAEVGERVATVTTQTLRVRTDASTDASVLGLIGGRRGADCYKRAGRLGSGLPSRKETDGYLPIM